MKDYNTILRMMKIVSTVSKQNNLFHNIAFKCNESDTKQKKKEIK